MALLTPPERIGTVVGARYELLRVVGEGASAVMFAARDRALEREVGVKVMRPSGTLADKTDRDRFRREAQTLARLRHPNMVDVFDVGEAEDGQPFVVMELLRGETLAARLERTPVLSVEDTLAFLLPLMGALACAHELGVIHRDIKPANIFLHQRGSITPVGVPGTGASSRAPLAKLLDFGIAKLANETTITGTGMTLGTPAFMAPEQARGEVLSPATDVWAMGVTLYMCLSGRLPFAAPTVAGILMQAMRHGVPRLSAPGVDPLVGHVVERALEVEPSRRIASMRGLAHALVQAGMHAGLQLPADPDPVGLPEYAAWCAATEGEDGTAELPVTSGGTSASVQPVPSTVVQSSRAISTVRRRRVGPLVAAAALGTSALVSVPLLWSRAPASVPAKTTVPVLAHTTEPVQRPAALDASSATAQLPQVPPTAAAPIAPIPLPSEPEKTPDARPASKPSKKRPLSADPALSPRSSGEPAPASAEPAARPLVKQWDW